MVNAPSRRLGRGALAGHFGGVGANATVGVGFGANLLVGGSDNSISLQPLSLQGQTGLSVVAGIVDVELRPAICVGAALQAASASPSPSSSSGISISTLTLIGSDGQAGPRQRALGRHDRRHRVW